MSARTKLFDKMGLNKNSKVSTKDALTRFSENDARATITDNRPDEFQQQLSLFDLNKNSENHKPNPEK